MKNTLFILSLFFLSLTAHSQKAALITNETGANVQSFDDKPVQVLYFGGTAYNLIADKYDGMLCKFKTYDNGRLALEGMFNNINLFGRFNIDGKKVSSYANGKSAYIFSGLIVLGLNDNSGFPPNTKAQFEVTVIIDEYGGEGIYTVGKIPGFVNYEQAGTLNLFKVPKYD